MSNETKNALRQAPRWFLQLLALAGIASVIQMVQRLDTRLENIEAHIKNEEKWRHAHELGHAELHSDMRMLRDQMKRSN